MIVDQTKENNWTSSQLYEPTVKHLSPSLLKMEHLYSIWIQAALDEPATKRIFTLDNSISHSRNNSMPLLLSGENSSDVIESEASVKRLKSSIIQVYSNVGFFIVDLIDSIDRLEIKQTDGDRGERVESGCMMKETVERSEKCHA